MWGALALGGTALGLGSMLYDPIKNTWFPDTDLVSQRLTNKVPDASTGGFDFTKDDLWKYRRSNLDDMVKEKYGDSSPENLEKYIRDVQHNRLAQEVNNEVARARLQPGYEADRAYKAAMRASELEGIKHNRAELTSARLFREAQLRHQQEQAALKASYRNDDLIRQNRLDLRALENNALELTNNQALALAELQEKKNRSAWERGIYEDQLERDEQQRIRDQRKFYALLGQSVLSEGLKAFF